MKKLVVLSVIALLAMGAVFAQSRGRGNQGGFSQPVTVNGTLQLLNGQIAVADGTAVYFVPTIGRYIGFIEGLKEGARVSVEGYAYGNYLQPGKLTIDGKTYDFPAGAYSPGLGQGRGGFMQTRGGYGRCCY